MSLEEAMKDASKAESIKKKELWCADPGIGVLAQFTNGYLKTSKRVTITSGKTREILKTEQYNRIRCQIQNSMTVTPEDKASAIQFLNQLQNNLSAPNESQTLLPNLEATKSNDIHKYGQFLSSFISEMKTLLSFSPTVHALLEHQKQITKDINLLQISTTTSSHLYNTLKDKVSMFFQIALNSYYNSDILRKLKLQSLRNNEEWEQHTLQKLALAHGKKPEEIVIVFGDYERKAGHKGSKSSMGVKLLRLLRKAGYEVYIMNESYTSVKCSNCKNVNAECYNFESSQRKKWVDLKHMKNPPSGMVHSLLKCGLCSTIFQRDINGSNNIYYKARCIIDGLDNYKIYLKSKYN